MEAAIKEFAHFVALGCTLVAVLILASAAATAAYRVAVQWRRFETDMPLRKEIWLRFAASIVLALEFALAADIADTAVAPSWEEIGQLAAIATIRTLLNLFLERDIDAFRDMQVKDRAGGAPESGETVSP